MGLGKALSYAGKTLSRPGKVISRFLGKDWVLLLEVVSPIHLAVSAWYLDKNDLHQWKNLWPLAAIIVQAFVVYLSKCLGLVEKEDKDATQKHAASVLVRSKKDSAGNMAHLLRALIDGEPSRCEQLQRDFLTHAVRLAKSTLNVESEDDRLTATWAVPASDYSTWHVAAYDRHQANRQTGRARDIREGIPGAATAFLSGTPVFIVDTHEPTIADWFKGRPYRSILSIPARAMNVTKDSNVTLEGQPSRIVGVLNLDCSECGVITLDHEHALKIALEDIAYVIAILEQLRGGTNG